MNQLKADCPNTEAAVLAMNSLKAKKHTNKGDNTRGYCNCWIVKNK